MGARGTYKPCPVCEEEGYRSVGKPCRVCLALIEEGKEYREFKKAEMRKKENMVVVCPANWCKPQTYLTGLHSGNYDNEVMGKCLRDLALKLSINSGLTPAQNPKFHLYKRRHRKFDHGIQRAFDWREPRIMDKQIAGLLHRLFFAIDRTMVLVRSEAVAYGKNVLMQLTEGKITLDEFESTS